MTGFRPFSQYSPHASIDRKGNCGVGWEVPAGSSFINQMGIPIVSQVPCAKTNRWKDDHTLLTNESHTIVGNGSMWGNGV